MTVSITYNDKEKKSRDAVAKAAKAKGLTVQETDESSHTVEVSGPESAEAFMADLAPVGNIQLALIP